MFGRMYIEAITKFDSFWGVTSAAWQHKTLYLSVICVNSHDFGLL